MIAELRVLWSLARGRPRHGDHAARLEAFYAPQADHYDAFRERLLHGREQLARALDLRPGMHVVELGAGTGRNLDFLGAAVPELGSVELVDLCPALLRKAEARAARFPNVRVVHADATTHRPARAPDVVFFSYSLSMIPAWERALANAVAMLAPGGRLGIVDFWADPARHGALGARFWRSWFGHDGVLVSDAIRRAGMSTTDRVFLAEGAGALPWVPFLRVPWFAYVGRRPATDNDHHEDSLP